MNDVAPLFDEPLALMEAPRLTARYRPVNLSLGALADRVRSAPVCKKRAAVAPGLFFGLSEQRDGDATINGSQVQFRSAVVLDLEGDAVPQDVPERTAALPWAALTYASPSYRRPLPRWRVVIPSADRLDLGQTYLATMFVVERLGSREWTDLRCTELSRRFFAPMIAENNPDREFLEREGLPCHLTAGTQSRRFALSDIPEGFDPPPPSHGARRPGPAGGKRKDPRAAKGSYGVFARCYELDDVIRMSEDWPCGRLPYAPSPAGEGKWYWTGAKFDGDEEPTIPSLTRFPPGMPSYFDHSDSPLGGTTLAAIDLAASWMYGDLAEKDGRTNYDAGASQETTLPYRRSTRMFLEFVDTHPNLFPEYVAETLATSERMTVEAASPAPSSKPEVPLPSKRGAWSVKRIEGKLTKPDSKLTRKLSEPGDKRILALHDPVLRTLVQDVRSGEVGWCEPLPDMEVDDNRRSILRDRGFLPRRVEDLALVQLYLERVYAHRSIAVNTAKSILDVATANARSVDPFRDYLESLPAWDGVPRLGRWHAGVADDPDDQLALRRFAISLVARTFDPGCEVGWIPVLIGAQDTLKTTTLQWLTGGRYFRLMDLDEPHLMEKLVRHPLVIWDEFHLSQSDRDPYVNRAKALITGSSDIWHVNYSTSETEAARMWVMAATANSFDIPSSMEGTRRFMPVRIVSDGGERSSDGSPAWRTEDLREQVLAEAVAAFRAGEPFTLSDPAGREAQRRALARVREDAPETEDIARFLSQEWPSGWCAASADERAFYRRQRASTPNLEVQSVPGELTLLPVVTVKVLLQDALCLPPAQCASQRVRTRVKAVLKELGWVPGKRRVGGLSTAVWLRPAPDPVSEATRLTAEAAGRHA